MNDALRVVIKNWEDAQETNHPLILLRGIVCSSVDIEHVKVECESFPEGIEQNGFHFKSIHPLHIGDNTISFKVTALYHGKGELVKYHKLQISFKPQETDHNVKFYYVTASDQPNRQYDGYRQEIARKGQSKKPSYALDLTQSALELAMQKVGIAGLLIQCAFHELISRHHLESLISFPIAAGMTFSCKINNNFPLRGGAHVELIVLNQKQAELEKLSGQELWNLINSQIPDDGKTVKVAVMGMTRWEPEMKNELPLCHTALGGFPLALFGSGNIYSWPTCVAQIHDCFQDKNKIPQELFDDSGNRNSMWANCATGIGAILHEIGHSFQLRHTRIECKGKFSQILKFPVMGRGFDMFNRIFTLSEPSKIGDKISLLLENEESNLHSHSVSRLLFNPFFATAIKHSVSMTAPLIERQGGLICVRSGVGIVEISLYNLDAGDVVFTQSLGVFPPTFYSFSIANVRKLLGSGNSSHIGCTAMDLHGSLTNEILPLKRSLNSSVTFPFVVTIPDEEGTQQVNEESRDEDLVKFRSKIRLKHMLTSQYLQSYPVNYVHLDSPGFQQVSCAESTQREEITSEWEIISLPGNEDSGCILGSSEFEIRHVATGQYLHSHGGIPSPLTHQQEVCCFANEQDENNIWILVPKDLMENRWPEGDLVMLRHKLTANYLHSHGGFSSEEFTLGQQEVTCYPIVADDNNFFVAEIIRD